MCNSIQEFHSIISETRHFRISLDSTLTGVLTSAVSALIALLHYFIVFAKKHEIRVFLGQKASLFIDKIGIVGSCPQDVFWAILQHDWSNRKETKENEVTGEYIVQWVVKSFMFFSKKNLVQVKVVRSFMS